MQLYHPLHRLQKPEDNIHEEYDLTGADVIFADKPGESVYTNEIFENRVLTEGVALHVSNGDTANNTTINEDHLSSCKSPHQMQGAIIKSYYAQKNNIDPKDIFVVSIMPCPHVKCTMIQRICLNESIRTSPFSTRAERHEEAQAP